MSEYQPVEYYVIAEIGECGDGGVRLRYDPNPPDHRSKFELEFVWNERDIDTVYIGDIDNLRTLHNIIHQFLDGDGDE